MKVDGTLNKRNDQDKGWVAEIAIPLSDVGGLGAPGGEARRRRWATPGG